MTLNELEKSLLDVKTMIYEALLIDRENQPLRDQARALQEYVNQIKLSRDSMEQQEIPLQSLHTVSLNSGLSYQSAERILSMNPQIKNPTFANGLLKVIVPKK